MYLPLSSLEKDEFFKELPDKTKLEICKARIQELEKTLAEYVCTCSSLVTGVYKTVAEKVQTTECDNYEVHRCGVNERFKLSCKCCRRRVQNANCDIEYWAFRTYFKKLFDLEHCNRTARQCKSSAAASWTACETIVKSGISLQGGTAYTNFTGRGIVASFRASNLWFHTCSLVSLKLIERVGTP